MSLATLATLAAHAITAALPTASVMASDVATNDFVVKKQQMTALSLASKPSIKVILRRQFAQHALR